MLAAMMLEDARLKGASVDSLMEFIDESVHADPPVGRFFRKLLGLDHTRADLEAEDEEVVDDMSFNPMAGFPGLAPMGVVGGGS